MAGYANRVITLHFPDLAEPGDDIHVVMRNPKLVPPDELRKRAESIALGPDGEPVDTDAAMNASYDVLAKLIIGWHVYDATSPDDDQPVLPLPATAASVGKLPLEIISRLTDELVKVNPPMPTASPEAGTSTS